jgi:hypothetical protein
MDELVGQVRSYTRLLRELSAQLHALDSLMEQLEQLSDASENAELVQCCSSGGTESGQWISVTCPSNFGILGYFGSNSSELGQLSPGSGPGSGKGRNPLHKGIGFPLLTLQREQLLADIRATKGDISDSVQKLDNIPQRVAVKVVTPLKAAADQSRGKGSATKGTSSLPPSLVLCFAEEVLSDLSKVSAVIRQMVHGLSVLSRPPTQLLSDMIGFCEHQDRRLSEPEDSFFRGKSMESAVGMHSSWTEEELCKLKLYFLS